MPALRSQGAFIRRASLEKTQKFSFGIDDILSHTSKNSQIAITLTKRRKKKKKRQSVHTVGDVCRPCKTDTLVVQKLSADRIFRMLCERCYFDYRGLRRHLYRKDIRAGLLTS